MTTEVLIRNKSTDRHVYVMERYRDNANARVVKVLTPGEELEGIYLNGTNEFVLAEKGPGDVG